MANVTKQLRISEIKDITFVIPSYQRGYRWTKKNAEQLLKDLVNFVKGGDEDYCLQPIVLQELEKNTFRVVDGQQRLTTLAIMITLLLGKDFLSWNIVYTSEDNKPLTDLLRDPKKHINDYFRQEVKSAVEKYLTDNNSRKALEDLFLGKTLTPKNLFFIAYYIDKENNDPEGHKAFRRLNSGKTPLTSSELIRALYMVNASGIEPYKRIEISKEWELIENTLKNDQFWFMFNAQGLEDTPTRIDLLFALVLSAFYDIDGQDENKFSLVDTKANPRIVFERLEGSSIGLQKLWNEILRCFWWMQSCYADVELYNYLCWICLFGTNNSAKDIYKIYQQYPRPCDFKKKIINIIQREYESKSFSDFSYADIKKRDFVLLNIIDCNHSKERFRFDLYKAESWDIEHISSQTPNELKNDGDKKSWLYYAYTELDSVALKEIAEHINESNPNNVYQYILQEHNQVTKNKITDASKLQECIDNISLLEFEEKTSILQQLFSKRIAPSEQLVETHKIGNLALLNTHINRSYKNAIFPAKSRIIKGYINSGSCYIPPCTAKAFMKFYTTSPSNNLAWMKSDYEGYKNVLEKWYKEFMEIPTEAETFSSHIIDISKDNSGMPNSISIADDSKSNEHKKRIDGETDFGSLMEQYQIVVPAIQRLYVQGRTNKRGSKCLESFASDLVRSVTEKVPTILDFIYGIDTNCEIEFRPIDGQQRLTTLLLLAWLCGKSKSNWVFKYESRRATEMFMENLLRDTPPRLLKPSDYEEQKKKIKKQYKKEYLPLCSNHLRNTGWFLAAWENDPGIAGMLEMLDSLYDKLLNATTTHDFDMSHIKFFVQYLDVSKDSYDQIFLKMNSRGRELSSWDNVKAVLDEYSQYLPSDLKSIWIDSMPEWYEKVWAKYAEKSIYNIEKVDTKMISIVELALDVAGYTGKATNTFQLSKWLEEQEEKVSYFYNICQELFSAVEDNNYNSLLKTALTPNWSVSGEARIADFTVDDQNKIVQKFYQPLLAFYAARKSTNSEWIRVVWNLLENINIDKSSFKQAIRLFDEIFNEDSILAYLNKNTIQSIKTCYKDAARQLDEEIAKANQILEKRVNINREGPNEQDIIEAEKYGFFRGAIRFLFSNEEGNMSNWSNFFVKWQYAKEYFNKDGVKPEWNDARLLRAIISRQKDFWSTMWWSYQIFNNSKDNWRGLLLNETWQNPVHHILMGNVNISDNKDKYISPLLEKDFLEFIMKEQSNAWIRPSGKFHAIWTSRYRKYRIIINDILHDLAKREQPKITFTEPIGDSGYAKGNDGCIDFLYRDYHFRWQESDWVDMYDGNTKLYDTEKGKSLHSLYKGQHEHSFVDVETLLSELNRCIDTFEKMKYEH